MNEAIQISIWCLAIHALFWEAMFLFWLGGIIHGLLSILFYALTFGDPVAASKAASWLIKPLFDCLICMSSFWTVILGHCCMGIEWQLIPGVMLSVLGMNVIADSAVYFLRNR